MWQNMWDIYREAVALFRFYLFSYVHKDIETTRTSTSTYLKGLQFCEIKRGLISFGGNLLLELNKSLKMSNEDLERFKNILVGISTFLTPILRQILRTDNLMPGCSIIKTKAKSISIFNDTDQNIYYS